MNRFLPIVLIGLLAFGALTTALIEGIRDRICGEKWAVQSPADDFDPDVAERAWLTKTHGVPQ